MHTFDYAIVRVVPDVAREEFVNVGAVLFSHAYDYLEARIALDERRLLALSADVDLDIVTSHLEAFQRLCVGGPDAGPLGLLPRKERWHWLVAPKSTIVQTSAAHTGMCADPARMLEHVVARMVRAPRRAPPGD